ncbi:MAG: hypothetical protein IPK26_02810 [Planctomycetes bacterium]|nr:hypothetical protein [Planctomycetota bacterium]
MFDESRQRTVIFGGGDDGTVGPILGEMWDYDGNTWTQMPSAGPGPRWGHTLTWDSTRQTIVLFGGSPDGSSVLDETWTWNGVWTQRQPALLPGARRNHGAAFDRIRGRLVLFGGFAGPFLNDTWEWDGTGWQLVAATAPIQPIFNMAMVFDRAAGVTMLFGGRTLSSFGSLNGTWTWNGTTWTALTPVNAPTPRFSAALVYDDARGRPILYGGRDRNGTFGDTWEWSGANWVPIAGTIPPVRDGPAAAFDSARARMVMFGGSLTFGPGPLPFGDTWEYGTTGLAAIAAFGQACGQPPLQAMPAPGSRPILGQTLQIDLTGVPANAPFMAYGVSDRFVGAVPLPLSLANIGAPGCDVLQSSELLAMPCQPTGPGTARHVLALPGNPALIGVRLFAQPWGLAPGANAAGILTGNGLSLFSGTF